MTRALDNAECDRHFAVTSLRRLHLTHSESSYLDGWEPVPGLDLGRRYKNAPIVEAILEFRVAPTDERVTRLASLDFGESFGEPQTIYNVEHEVKFDNGTISSQTRDNQVGFAFSTDDNARTIQVSAQSFAFICRGHYSHWDDFMSGAERAWEIYRDTSGPSKLVGIGVRFVNHIPMPNRPVEIKDYLRISVDIPAQLPQTLSGLFMQVDIPLAAQEAQATVTSTFIEGTKEQPGGWMLLDIDVKTLVNRGTADPAFDEVITATLDRLRLAKNYVFEACVTDATRGLMG